MMKCSERTMMQSWRGALHKMWPYCGRLYIFAASLDCRLAIAPFPSAALDDVEMRSAFRYLRGHGLVDRRVLQAHTLLGQATHNFKNFWSEKGKINPILQNPGLPASTTCSAPSVVVVAAVQPYRNGAERK